MASFSQSWKADNKARRRAGKAERTFEQFKAAHARMAELRAKRGQKQNDPAAKLQAEIKRLQAQIDAMSAPAPAKAQRKSTSTVEREYSPVPHRVDCFSVNKTGIVTLAVDKSDHKRAVKALTGLYCLEGDSYESDSRGARVRLYVQQAQIVKAHKALASAGLNPAGKRGWKRAGVVLV